MPVCTLDDRIAGGEPICDRNRRNADDHSVASHALERLVEVDQARPGCPEQDSKIGLDRRRGRYVNQQDQHK